MLSVLRHSHRGYWRSECRLATGRSAIKHLIKVAKPPVALMPCYVPEGVIAPFSRADIPISFYRLRSDLTPDLRQIEALGHKGAIVVVIHYFGRITPTGEIRTIVNHMGGLLFEDCAHAPLHKAIDADVALWSLNKFLPTVDGAILKSRCTDVDVTCEVKRELPAYVMADYHEHLDTNAEVAATGNLSLLEKSSAAYERYYKFISEDLDPYAQSAESRCIEGSLHVTNSIFANPIMILRPSTRDQAFDVFTRRGILPSTLTDKWDHIPKDVGFVVERDFIERHLLLPIGVYATQAIALLKDQGCLACQLK